VSTVWAYFPKHSPFLILRIQTPARDPQRPACPASELDRPERELLPLVTHMSHASPNYSAFLSGPTALYRASQLRKRFAKLRGRTTGNSLKRAIEVRHGLKSACEGSFANSRIGIEQKRLRFLHSNSRELVGEIYPSRFLEHLTEVMPADISHLGDSPTRQPLHLIYVVKFMHPTRFHD